MLMNQWSFVIGAYAVAAVGTLALTLASWARMRQAERAVEGLRRR
jgi:hypothetical protein